MSLFDDGRLDGRTIAVTGAASGIGYTTALLATSRGARVVAGDLALDWLAPLVADVAQVGGDVLPVAVDVTDTEQVAYFARSAADPNGVAGLVCCAGIVDDVSFLKMTPEQWQRVLHVNLTGTFLVAQQIARSMVTTGGGSIVTVASSVFAAARPNTAHYAASKGGVIGLTRSMAAELAGHRIRVNAVAPGGTDTELFRSRTTAEYRAVRAKQVPLARLGQPEDHAQCICYLLSAIRSVKLGDWPDLLR